MGEEHNRRVSICKRGLHPCAATVALRPMADFRASSLVWPVRRRSEFGAL